MSTILPYTCRRILVVDDNESIHDDIRRILLSNAKDADLAEMRAVLFGEAGTAAPALNVEVEWAPQGQEALEMVRGAVRERRPYEMAFVDVRMPPGWDGLETAARLWQADPRLEIVICTAYSDYSWGEIVRRLGQTDRLLILKKPFHASEIRQIVLALTRKWRLNREAETRRGELESLVRVRTNRLKEQNRRLRREIRERERIERRRQEAEAEKLRLLEQLYQAQRLEAVGQVANGVVHDISNLLTVIRGCTAEIRRSLPQDTRARGAIDLIDQAADHARSVICGRSSISVIRDRRTKAHSI